MSKSILKRSEAQRGELPRHALQQQIVELEKQRDELQAGFIAEREACANMLNLTRSDVQLMAGEMTAQEWRTMEAVLKALQSQMKGDKIIALSTAKIEKQRDALIAAGQALVDRWDTPNWKDAPHTGEFIARLRDAIEWKK